MAEPNLSEEEKGVLEQFIIPFFNTKKRFPLHPGKGDTEAESRLLGMSVSELQQVRKNLDENARHAALELLKEDEVVDLLDEFPFDGEETIVAFGDSITEDLQGWFEIFKHVLEISTENASFTFVNAGMAYDTTSEALRRLDRDVLLHEPDWVIVALGTFDTQRLNIAPDRTLIPLSETWENLTTIQQVVEQHLNNPPIWLTPSPVISEMLTEHPIYTFQITENDLQQVTDLVSGKTGGIVDPKGERMGKEKPEAWNYLSDGLHHSLSGHMNTVRELLRTLKEIKTST